MSSPSSRYRNNGIKYFQGGNAYVTYADRESSPIIANNITPPHNYSAVSQLVHKDGLTPESRADFKARGFYQTDYYDGYRSLKNSYWIGNNSLTINFDTDTVYINGEYQSLITYNDSHPHPQAHWAIVTAAIKEFINASDITAWANNGYSNDNSIIGKRAVVVVMFDKNAGHKLAVYALLSIMDLALCYERALPDYDFEASDVFEVVGFKTDATTLVYWNRTYPTGGGLYKVVFNHSYTNEERLKIAETAYPVYDQINTLTETTEEINAAITINSSNEGHTIVDVFFIKITLPLFISDTVMIIRRNITKSHRLALFCLKPSLSIELNHIAFIQPPLIGH